MSNQLALIPQTDLASRPEPDEIRFQLGRLFDAFITQERQNPEAAIRTYIEALEEFSAAEVRAGVSMFIKGQWPAHETKYVPSCAMVARACRQAAGEIKARALRDEAAAAVAKRRARETAKAEAEARHAKQIELERARRTPEQQAAWIETMKRQAFTSPQTPSLSDD